MSRPSTNQLLDFVHTPPFEQFLDVLTQDIYVTNTKAVSLWPIDEFPNARARRQEVSAKLNEIARRSCLPFHHPECITIATDANDWRLRLRTAQVPALIPTDDFFGDKPIYRRSSFLHPNEEELQKIASQLHSRIPDVGIVRLIKVFCQPEEFQPKRPSFRPRAKNQAHIDRPLPVPIAFSAGALRSYDEDLKSEGQVSINREGIISILSNLDFLCSPNGLLFLAEVRDRVTTFRGSKPWALQVDSEAECKNHGLPIIRTRFPQVRFFESSDSGQFGINDVRLAFAGALDSDAVRTRFAFDTMRRHEVHVELW